jgi:hypothetical protein
MNFASEYVDNFALTGAEFVFHFEFTFSNALFVISCTSLASMFILHQI